MLAIEQMLYGRYPFGQQMGEWGPYEALIPTEKMRVWLCRLQGGLVGVVIWCGLFDLSDGGGVFDNHFVLSAQWHIHTGSVLGGYCRVKVH